MSLAIGMLSTPGQCARLDAYEKLVASWAVPWSTQRKPVFLCNIAHNTGFCKHVSSTLPALLESTRIWRVATNPEDDRLMNSWEHMVAQAMPIKELLPKDHPLCGDGALSELSQLHLSPASVRQLAGNAFNLSVFGNVMVFKLMTTSRLVPEVTATSVPAASH